jgi:hypothetical protein
MPLEIYFQRSRKVSVVMTVKASSLSNDSFRSPVSSSPWLPQKYGGLSNIGLACAAQAGSVGFVGSSAVPFSIVFGKGLDVSLQNLQNPLLVSSPAVYFS